MEKEYNFTDVPVSTGLDIGPAQKIIASGQALTQTRTPYQCAISVMKPRVLEEVRRKVFIEARLAKDEFYYRWRVKSSDGKISWIEGGTIGLAQAIMVNYNNCVIKPKVEERNGKWYFETNFIDFENGITVSRLLNVKIPTVSLGGHGLERTINMRFQIEQSKNIRDTIFNATPRWLRKDAIEEAKKASAEDVEKNREKILKKAKEYFEMQGIKDTEIASFLGKTDTRFTNRDITIMRNMVVQLQNGDITSDNIKEYSKTGFETKADKKREKKKTDKVKEKTIEDKPSKTDDIRTDIRIDETDDFRKHTGFSLEYFQKADLPAFEGFMNVNRDKMDTLPHPITFEIKKKYKEIYGKPFENNKSTLKGDQTKTTSELTPLQKELSQIIDTIGVEIADKAWEDKSCRNIPQTTYDKLSDDHCKQLITMINILADTHKGRS